MQPSSLQELRKLREENEKELEKLKQEIDWMMIKRIRLIQSRYVPPKEKSEEDNLSSSVSPGM